MSATTEMHIWNGQQLEQLEQNYRRDLINCLSGFKSANLIGSVNADGETNLAIFNSVMHIGANPPFMGIVVRPITVPRNTYSNIKQTGFFTINAVQASFLEKAHQTSANYPAQLSEFDECKLTPLYSALHPAPYVLESTVRIGLELNEELHVKSNGTIILIGRIIEVQVPKELVAKDGFVALEKAGTVSVVGLDAYYNPTPIKRLAYARPQAKPGNN